MKYIISRVGAQFGALLLMLVLCSPLLEQGGRGAEQTNMNAFMLTFFAASIQPIWRREVAFKARLASLVVGVAVSMSVGIIYLAGSNGAFDASPDIVALSMALLVALIGPTCGWFASRGALRWFVPGVSAAGG
jgi:hypothetical protein